LEEEPGTPGIESKPVRREDAFVSPNPGAVTKGLKSRIKWRVK
jgi:hypothetical protein